MTERSGRRESSKRRTRQALLEAGLAEVIEKGVDRPSLDAICARAGFTRGAFYVHFKDRRDFLTQLTDWTFRSFLDRTLATPRVERGIDETIGRFLSALQTHQAPLHQMGMRLSQLLETTARSPESRRAFQRFISDAVAQLTRQTERAQANGAVRSEPGAEPVAQLLISLAIGVMLIEELDAELDLDRMGETLLGLLAR